MADKKEYDFLIEEIKRHIQPATGCTEPVAIALNCATARREVKGNIKKVTMETDIGLYKNALGVGIPGTSERGLKMCAALGIVGGNADYGLNVFQDVKPEHEPMAKELLPLIEVGVKGNTDVLYIETIMETEEDCVRVITYGSHDNIVVVDRPPFTPFTVDDCADMAEIQKYTLEQMKEFADYVSLEKIEFLEEGVAMNREVARCGAQLRFGKSLQEMRDHALMEDSLLSFVPLITGSASFARMSGVDMPVMTATGSGNQGITLFLTVDAAAEKIGCCREKKLRALALANVINIYAKSFIGTLSPICACGVASGLGASVGIVYLLGGKPSQMLGAMRNVLGSITGMICDGAKEGCANKVSLASTSAVLSALLAMHGSEISSSDGILSYDMKELFENMEYLSNQGMKDTNAAIVDIMMRK